MNVACDYEAPMQMLTTEKYIASSHVQVASNIWSLAFLYPTCCVL